MTGDDFRRIALGMTDASEGAHMDHPDFRVRGRIFATLRRDERWGMVKLMPDQQQEFVRNHPAGFAPVNGAWGLQGCTAVRLDAVDEETMGEALTLAWQRAAAEIQARPRRARNRPAPTTPVAIRTDGRTSPKDRTPRPLRRLTRRRRRP